MHVIRKKIVTDEDSRPVAIRIDYEDWLEIEYLLKSREAEKPADDRQGDFEAKADKLGSRWKGGESRYQELLEKTSRSWKGGDWLEYQIRIREGWDDR